MYKQPALILDCEGLSRKSIAELAETLSMYFYDVEVFDEEIECNGVVNKKYYPEAWREIDRYGIMKWR